MAEILAEYLGATAALPFEYGKNDCATLCIGWLDRLTGRDGLSQWRGKYTDRPSCAAFIASGGGHVEIGDRFLRDVYGVAHATDRGIGNVILAKAIGERAFGIRASHSSAVFRTPRGLISTPRFHVVTEWQCPNSFR